MTGNLETYNKRGVRKAVIPRPLSIGEERLALHLKAHGIPYEREVLFHPRRKWRFDFVIFQPSDIMHGLAVEVEGGIHNGRHTRAKGFSEDIIKYNQAVMDGWFVLRYTTDHVDSGKAIRQIMEYINRL